MAVRKKFVWRDGELVEIDPEYQAPARPGITIIGDEMPDTIHPCNGRAYSSKSEFRKITKAAGCVELGNERIAPRQYQPTGVKEDILRAYDTAGRR